MHWASPASRPGSASLQRIHAGVADCDTPNVRLTPKECWERLRAGDHAVLCTTNAKRTIDAVPVCFATVGKVIASPIDLVKAKATTELGRIKNLDLDERDPVM